MAQRQRDDQEAEGKTVMSNLPTRQPQASGCAPKVQLVPVLHQADEQGRHEDSGSAELAQLAAIEHDFQLRSGYGGSFRDV